MAIPPRYLTDYPCDLNHKPRHKNKRECYLATWAEPPMRWVKRSGPPTFYSSTGARSWHLAVGLRRDTGYVQNECNIGDGPGPYLWRETPILEGRESNTFCRRCVAAWTREVSEVTVRMQGIKIKRKQLVALLAEMPDADFAEVEFRATSVEDQPALIAEWMAGGHGRNEDVYQRFLLIADGLVKLGTRLADQTPD